MCAATTGVDAFSMVAWNPNAHTLTERVRIPVTGASWAVKGPDGSTVEAQAVALDPRTLQLPLLYLNKFGMNDVQVAAALDDLENNATHHLVFEISVPPVGSAAYAVTKATDESPAAALAKIRASSGDFTVENKYYSLGFINHTLTSITNKAAEKTVDLGIQWGWYNSSVGGCTEYGPDVPKDIQEDPCSGQSSGAYIFRPNSSDFLYPAAPSAPISSIVEGPLVTEVFTQVSEWATHVIRLYKDANYVEVEWTAGPIPIDTPWFDQVNPGQPNNWGKELVVRYTSGVASQGAWYTDSNGKEMLRRVYNKRGPTYPMPYNISEPVAGNYYPVNAMMSLDDGTYELAILTDVSQGGASLMDGSLEFMVHRRLQQDDSRGVQEPLNETMCGCNDIGATPGQMGAHGHEGDGGCDCEGLTMRGRHWLIFDTIDNTHEARRVQSEVLNFPATLAFHKPAAAAAKLASGITQALPPLPSRGV